MAVAELKAAFNLVAEPAFSCDRAFLFYEHAEGTQWQRLRFRGTSAAGAEFDELSDLLPPGADVIAAARDVAQRMLDQPPLAEPPP